MDRTLKNVIVWAAIGVSVLLLFRFFQAPSATANVMDSDRFAEALKDGRIAEVRLPRDATLEGTLNENGSDGKPARFVMATPAYRDLVDSLLKRNVGIRFYSPQESSLLVTLLSWIPILAVVGLWLFFMRKMQAAQKGAAARQGYPGASS
jgi:cell division protease FtsH